MKKAIHSIGTLLLASLVFALCTACEDSLVTKPSNLKLAEDQFANDASANEALVGLYAKLNYPNGGNQTITADLPTDLCLYTDELNPTNPNVQEDRMFLQNALNRTTPSVQTIWTDFYSVIYQANSLIDHVANSSGMSAAKKVQCTSEAKFIRAFCYFYLVNLYGDVPLVITSDYRIGNTIPRTPVQQVYQQMIADLTEAEATLSTAYPTADRVRVNQAVVKALLARIYLYTGEWLMAEQKATQLIGNTDTYQLEPEYSRIFLHTSNEAIWQLWFNQPYTPFRSRIGYTNGLYSQSASYGVQASLMDAFEAGDKRKAAFTFEVTELEGTSLPEPLITPSKYTNTMNPTPTTTEYYMIFRLAEQYLIRAEARARQNKIPEGMDDVNRLRIRAELEAKEPTTREALLLAIEQERRIELCYEWGDRFFHLKRTGRIDAVLSAEKPTWNPNAALFPIPINEFVNNPSLGSNNPGY